MTRQGNQQTVRLRITGAQDVFLLGKFNNWSTVATPLRHVGGWMWETTVPRGALLCEMAAFVLEQGRAIGRLCRLDGTDGPMMA